MYDNTHFYHGNILSYSQYMEMFVIWFIVGLITMLVIPYLVMYCMITRRRAAFKRKISENSDSSNYGAINRESSSEV